MKKYTISLGLNSKDLKVKYDYFNALQQVAKLLNNSGFKGATFKQAMGLWDGTLEDTLIAEIYTEVDELTKLKKVCELLRNQFNQECVLLNVEEAPTTLFI